MHFIWNAQTLAEFYLTYIACNLNWILVQVAHDISDIQINATYELDTNEEPGGHS